MVECLTMSIRLRPDHMWFRSRDGQQLVAGSPLTFFSVTEAGAQILSLIENNDLLPEGHEKLTDRLVAAGAAHPLWHMPVPADQLTVVIPSYLAESSDIDRLARLVRLLQPLNVIVVDDCSPEPIMLPDATVLRHDANKGPGAARNTGLHHVTTPFVAFVDDDASPRCDDLQRLAAQMNDQRVTLVAPRIRSTENGRLTGEYEKHHSPLDLGERPTLVRPLSRVSYVPATVLVCRTDTAKSLGGFEESMRIGEDVDFVWRMVEAGHLCRYEPTISCEHETRITVRSLLKQRFAYGSSAAALARRHGSAATPLRANIVMLVPALTLLLGYAWLFLPLLPFVYVWYLLTLHRSHLSYGDRARLTSLGLMSTVRLTASAIARVWWPIFFVVGLFVFSPGFALFASLLIPAVYGLVRHKPQRMFGYMGLRMADSIAYGAGVWSGALRQKSFRCLMPTVTGSALRLRSKG
jgi:mycofactocin glycosyltransferase